MPVGGNPQWVASGNISPSRFVSPVDSADFTCKQAGDNGKIVGISMEGTREAPIPSVSTSYSAQDGESLQIYGATEVCLLELGGTVKTGDDLSSDSDGKGVQITDGSTVQEVGALALEGGVSGDLILVQVTPRSEGNAAVYS